MTIDTTLIETCRHYHAIINHSKEIVCMMEKPRIGSDTLEAVHDALTENYSSIDRRTATRAEMLVLIWLYAPELLSSKRRSKKMIAIATTMGLKPNNAYAYRKSLLFSYKTYADFRDAVDKGISVAMDAARKENA